MDISVAIEIISTLGFPIALSMAMGWMFFKIFTWQRIDSKDRETKDRETLERFSGIISKNSDALLKNAQVMKQISSKLEDVDTKVDTIARDVQEIKIKQEK